MEKKRYRDIILQILSICLLLFCGFVFWQYGYSVTKIGKYICLIAFSIYIAGVDKREFRIPNKTLIYMLLLRAGILLIEFFLYPAIWTGFMIHTACGMSVGFGVLFICYYLSKKSIGMGDVKFCGVIGAYTGAGLVYVIIIISCIAAAVYGVIQVLRKKMTVKEGIPFGPFLLIGIVSSLLIGF